MEEQMASPGFWDNQDKAQKIVAELNHLKTVTAGIRLYKNQLEDAQALLSLVQEAGLETGAEFEELKELTSQLKDSMDALEIAGFLNGPHDSANAILSIHAGAGGTESCDWAEMLLRLYTRWAERRGFEIEVQDLQQGDEAGISKATLRIIGPYAYGYAKAERGVHRLVRISPFDSNKRRHTSFVSIDVIAEIEDDSEIDIPDSEMRVDTYRASGAGGQHVNKTDSAVRITHLPTGIVVTCQNERSQQKNRIVAMRTLKSRLLEKIADEKRSALEKFYGEKGEIGWGSQIRSYVMQPYQLVKDLRTGVETSNVQAVMDGDIDSFIHSWLRAGGPRKRMQSIADEEKHI